MRTYMFMWRPEEERWCVLFHHSSPHSLEAGSLTGVGAKLKIAVPAILLFLPRRASIISVCSHVWLFVLVLGIQTQEPVLAQQGLPTEPSLSPSKNCFKIHLWFIIGKYLMLYLFYTPVYPGWVNLRHRRVLSRSSKVLTNRKGLHLNLKFWPIGKDVT